MPASQQIRVKQERQRWGHAPLNPRFQSRYSSSEISPESRLSRPSRNCPYQGSQPTSTNAIFGAEETCAMLRIGRDEWMTVIEMQSTWGRAGARRTTSSGRERSTRTGSEGSSWCRGRQWTPTSSRGAAGNDGGDCPGIRPRPGTRGSLETKGSQARPRGWCHCASESGSYRQRQASGCYRKPAPTVNSRVP